MDEESLKDDTDKNCISSSTTGTHNDIRAPLCASDRPGENFQMALVEASSERSGDLKYAIVAAEGGDDEEMGIDKEHVHITEGDDNDLPVADEIPIARPASIFADIVVWEYARPFYEPNFGADPEEDLMRIPEREEAEERTPVFSAQDKANPCMCALKMIFIILMLPFYGLYKLLDYVICGEGQRLMLHFMPFMYALFYVLIDLYLFVLRIYLLSIFPVNLCYVLIRFLL